MKIKAYLYEITRDDGLLYIGVTIDPHRRSWQHYNGYGSKHLHNRNFNTKILAIGPEDYIYDLEYKLIDLLKPELNIVKGGKLGGSNPGAANGMAKLCEADVYHIRIEYANSKVSQEALASLYGVSRQAIGYIILGKTWKDSPGPIGSRINRVSAKDRAEIKRLKLEGKSISDISLILNIKWATVYSYYSNIY